MEPTGSELEGYTEDIPLPISPLPLLFAMAELRDEREASIHSPADDPQHRPKKQRLDSDLTFTPLRNDEILGHFPSPLIAELLSSEDPNENEKILRNCISTEQSDSEDTRHEEGCPRNLTCGNSHSLTATPLNFTYYNP
jgi:hypothetical protein